MAGSVCVYGVVAAPTITLEKHLGPYNFNLLVHQWPTRIWEAEAQEPLCDWIREGKIRAEDFISAEYPIEQIHDAIATSNARLAIKTMVRF